MAGRPDSLSEVRRARSATLERLRAEQVALTADDRLRHAARELVEARKSIDHARWDAAWARLERAVADGLAGEQVDAETADGAS